MKIGLISDIHANLPALKAVLRDGASLDSWICAGDVLGYYPHVNEVCNLLRKKNVATIRGNHDAYVIGELKPKPEHRLAYRTDWTRKKIKSGHFSWLASLPVELVYSFGKIKLKIRHANLWDEKGYVYKNSKAFLGRIYLRLNEVLVLGHTHHPLMIKRGKGFLVNPGSVGQPRDYNPTASYAVFDTKTGKVMFRRARYNVAFFQKQLIRMRWNTGMISILSRTKPRA